MSPPHDQNARRLSPSAFSAEQLSAWVGASEPKRSHAASETAPEASSSDYPDATQWFVAFTSPKRETTVAKMVKQRDLETYLPAMTVTRRRKTISHPLFARYVFVGVAPGKALYQLRQTPGLEGMVRVAGRPVTVSSVLLDGLREQERNGVFDFTEDRLARMEAEAAAVRRAEKIAALQPGVRVKVMEGPFASFGGVVEALLPPDRASVIVTIFGSRHPVPMMIDAVQPASRGRP